MLFVGDVYDLKISVAAGISGTNYCIRPRGDLHIPTALINQFVDLGTRILLKSQHTILQTVPRGINGFLQRGILCRPALVGDLGGPPVRAGMVGPPGPEFLVEGCVISTVMSVAFIVLAHPWWTKMGPGPVERLLN